MRTLLCRRGKSFHLAVRVHQAAWSPWEGMPVLSSLPTPLCAAVIVNEVTVSTRLVSQTQPDGKSNQSSGRGRCRTYVLTEARGTEGIPVGLRGPRIASVLWGGIRTRAERSVLALSAHEPPVQVTGHGAPGIFDLSPWTLSDLRS